MRPKSDHHDYAHYCVREPSFCAITNEDKMKIIKVTGPLPVYAHCLTSIPPRSKTGNKPRSDAHTESTPTTRAQNVVPSSAATRGRGRSMSQVARRTLQKSMKTRVTTSGMGEICTCTTFSYDACARKRKATYSCLSKSGSQYLRARPHPRILKRYLGVVVCFRFGYSQSVFLMREDGERSVLT